jgi:hypothetical protein
MRTSLLRRGEKYKGRVGRGASSRPAARRAYLSEFRENLEMGSAGARSRFDPIPPPLDELQEECAARRFSRTVSPPSERGMT